MIRRAILLTLILLAPLSMVVGADTAGRSCTANPPPGTSVHHITISPSGPLSMPADQALNLTAIAYDAAGTALNVPIAWTASSGSIQDFGWGDARWSPQTIGAQTVIACTGEIETVLNVEVQPGAPLTFELSVSQENITADETLLLTPLLRDQFGNGWIPNIPFVNWNLPAGADITLPNDGTPPILTPGPVGAMTVSVEWDGWAGAASFNVSRGIAVSAFIEHVSDHVSSDDLVDLCALYTDQRGNTWATNATWSTYAGFADDSLSSFTGECIVFDAGPLGEWTVEIDVQNGMTNSLTLTVEPGRLAQITLDNLATEMHIGDFYLLEAVGFDAAGNLVTVDGWNWTVTDGPSTDPIVPDGDGITFVPDKVGQHTIQVMAAGRVQAIDVEVLSGVPATLEIEVLDGIGTQSPVIVTGLSLDLILYGVDENGNRNPVDVPIEDWYILNDFGTIENASAGGTGHYTYTSSGIGDVSITVFLDQAQGVLIVQVLQGPLDYLEVILPTEGDQGTSVHFEIAGFDISGNPVDIHQCSATITTDAGEAECDENGWKLDLNTPGELVVHARIQSSEGTSAEGSDFITVHSTWFGWGDNTQVIIGGSLLIIISISTILVVLFKHLGSRIEEEIEIINEENEENEEEDQTPPPPLPHIGVGGVLPPPPLSHTVVHAPLPVATAPTPIVAASPAFPPISTPAPIVPYDPFAALEPVAEPEPELEPEVVEEKVEEDWAVTEPEKIPEPEPSIQTDDEWGVMSGDWDDGGDTLTSAAADFAQIQHENRRGDGPRDAAEQTLRPLPGTVAGEDGWYFDREGRPSHWTHTEENGWIQE